MTYNENNWYRWFYGKSEPFAPANGSVLRTEYGRINEPIKGFKQAMLDNARSTIDHFPNETFDLLFSGGIDSEVALRSYLEIGAKDKIRVNIFRYENNYNIYDVSFAVVVCEQLGVDYRIVDFNLKDFFENHAERVSEVAQSDRPRAIVQLGFLDYVEGVPISASSDCRWFRPHGDYGVKAEWRVQDFEHDIALDRYAHAIGRPAVMQWFKWSPQAVISWFSLDWFRRLVDDDIPGKEGVVSTKIQGYREAFPDIIARTKKTGFESPEVEAMVNEVQKLLEEKNGGLKFRQQTERSINEFSIEMTGYPYA